MDDQPAQAGRLKSRKAVIVGAGTRGNIGQTIARRFLDEGAQGGDNNLHTAALHHGANEGATRGTCRQQGQESHRAQRMV